MLKASSLRPVHLFAVVLAGWMNRHQQHAIDYLREENRVLRELLGRRRFRFTDAQRRRLAIKGRELGRALLRGIATLATPDVILAWHRRLVARKWTFPTRRHRNAEAMKALTFHLLRMAGENPTWGYDRLQGALANLGHTVSPSTIRNILLRNGIPPAPERGRHTPWRSFLKTHASTIFAADFFTTEVWTLRGLVTHYTLFVIHHSTRRIHIVATTPNPGAVFMAQAAKLLTDPIDGFLRGARHLILDRDTKFTAAFKSILKAAGIGAILTPRCAPNCNAIAERFVRSIKSECLSRMIFFGAASLDRAISEYAAHYNAERNHQGIGNALIAPTDPVGNLHGPVVRRQRLGGLLSFYHRRSAAA
jgi:transposase InsO family protein